MRTSIYIYKHNILEVLNINHTIFSKILLFDNKIKHYL